jgi:hypothetical protein
MTEATNVPKLTRSTRDSETREKLCAVKLGLRLHV